MGSGLASKYSVRWRESRASCHVSWSTIGLATFPREVEMASDDAEKIRVKREMEDNESENQSGSGKPPGMETPRRKKEEDIVEIPVWKRAFQRSAVWPDKDEFLDVIYWMQQALALIVGLLCGVLPLKGFLGFAAYGATSCLAVFWYSTNFQDVDLDDTFGDKTTVLKEGFPSSLATFLVTWIMVYTALHAF
ncbi:putative Uncharacterized protein C20orf24-like protein [Hypsibius exemplaris]|uniref:Rab5-interacting protein n=1 Tax=Hypsibius exemplaris TaxID=2072580 RepID=A0A1W0WGD1_HYPEX|nr:putative Uncharacterized protein C20orf24-like protein [Hypsibius exemplaris]